eukprot:356171-Hanusia_phi.AAC.4
MQKLRMQDVKIGRYTADANWMGKSTTAAFRNNIVDDITNSGREGYRLEGFDSMPTSVESFDPSAETGKQGSSAKEKKKIKRLQFQRLSAKKFLSFLLDLADVEEVVMLGDVVGDSTPDCSCAAEIDRGHPLQGRIC